MFPFDCLTKMVSGKKKQTNKQTKTLLHFKIIKSIGACIAELNKLHTFLSEFILTAVVKRRSGELTLDRRCLLAPGTRRRSGGAVAASLE